MQGAEKNFAAPHMIDMLARIFFRNAAIGMKSGFLEVPIIDPASVAHAAR